MITFTTFLQHLLLQPDSSLFRLHLQTLQDSSVGQSRNVQGSTYRSILMVLKTISGSSVMLRRPAPRLTPVSALFGAFKITLRVPSTEINRSNFSLVWIQLCWTPLTIPRTQSSRRRFKDSEAWTASRPKKRHVSG